VLGATYCRRRARRRSRRRHRARYFPPDTRMWRAALCAGPCSVRLLSVPDYRPVLFILYTCNCFGCLPRRRRRSRFVLPPQRPSNRTELRSLRPRGIDCSSSMAPSRGMRRGARSTPLRRRATSSPPSPRSKPPLRKAGHGHRTRYHGNECPSQGGGFGERAREHWYIVLKQSGSEC
jgi:hypothetical protein